MAGWVARCCASERPGEGALCCAGSARRGARRGASLFKIVTPRLKLAEKMRWATTWTDARVKLLGAAEVLGGAGLILPGLLHVLPVLTPVAAICLAVLMAGAVKTHLALKEPRVPPLLPLVQATVVVGGGRLVVVPWG
jgi:hypothetical protein